MAATLHLYLDDSGSRNPDHEPRAMRNDLIDYFALGGVLIRAEDIHDIYVRHRTFCRSWGITYPLHSSRIRGGRGQFGWLRKPENAAAFLPDLEQFLLALPVVGIAAVVDRPGYVARYRDEYHDQLWLMCKTAYSILVERATKHAIRDDRKLEIFFEGAGEREDRDIVAYTCALKHEGVPFSADRSAAYGALLPENFRSTILGEPNRRTKDVPMLQIADLYLYPMAKGGYDPEYGPYRRLMEAGKIVDAIVDNSDRAALGVKYSCFERVTQRPG